MLKILVALITILLVSSCLYAQSNKKRAMPLLGPQHQVPVSPPKDNDSAKKDNGSKGSPKDRNSGRGETNKSKGKGN